MRFWGFRSNIYGNCAHKDAFALLGIDKCQGQLPSFVCRRVYVYKRPLFTRDLCSPEIFLHKKFSSQEIFVHKRFLFTIWISRGLRKIVQENFAIKFIGLTVCYTSKLSSRDFFFTFQVSYFRAPLKKRNKWFWKLHCIFSMSVPRICFLLSQYLQRLVEILHFKTLYSVQVHKFPNCE